jgi:hypothetical protein
MSQFRYGKPKCFPKKDKKGESNMQTFQTRTRHKTSLTKAITWAFLSIGAIALFTSIVYVSSILAFIGLGLLFWGAILTYIQPEEYTKKVLLDAAVIPSLSALKQIIKELDYKGKAIYLPPKYLKDPEANKVYIPKQKEGKLPTPEHNLKQENQLLFKNPQGILLTPPGSQLTKLFEKTLNTNFAKTDLRYIIQNMSNLFIEDLEIAENLEIETKHDLIHVKIINSIFKEAHKENRKLSHLYSKIGCPLCSAIACALTKAIGKPITIENIQSSQDGKIIEATYRILGKIETEAILPEIKPEEVTKELITELIQLQIRKRFLPNLASLLLTAIGSILLTEVAWITFYDMTIWGKDIVQIFLGSRTGEAISFGIGIKIIHYFLIGSASFLSGTLTYLRRRSKV